MNRVVRTTLAMVAMSTLGWSGARALGPPAVTNRAPCDTPHVDGGGAASSSASAEERLSDWLVQQILQVESIGDPIIDYDAREIQDATGIDIDDVNLDRVRDRVHARLREAERWGDVRLRPAEDTRDAKHDTTNTGATDESAGSGSAAGRGATAAPPGGSRGH